MPDLKRKKREIGNYILKEHTAHENSTLKLPMPRYSLVKLLGFKEKEKNPVDF